MFFKPFTILISLKNRIDLSVVIFLTQKVLVVIK